MSAFLFMSLDSQQYVIPDCPIFCTAVISACNGKPIGLGEASDNGIPSSPVGAVPSARLIAPRPWLLSARGRASYNNDVLLWGGVLVVVFDRRIPRDRRPRIRWFNGRGASRDRLLTTKFSTKRNRLVNRYSLPGKLIPVIAPPKPAPGGRSGCAANSRRCTDLYFGPETPLLMASASSAGAPAAGAAVAASLPASANSPTYSILATAFRLSRSALAAFWRASACSKRWIAGLACSSVTGCTCESATTITVRPSGAFATMAWPSGIWANCGRICSGSCSAAFTPCATFVS